MLPDNWHAMSRNDQDAWSLTRHLEEDFPGHTFTVTMEPFNVRVNEDGTNPKDIQQCVDNWFLATYGTRVQWGTPVHVD